MAVVIETTIGDFTVDLYTEERPQTTRNFLKLCKLKYYNWNLFHSVQTNFIAQTGDPTGTGKGGESVYGIVLGEKARYYEAEQMPKIKHSRVGLLSMVNCGNNMLGSQFFITLGSELQSLDSEHCVFGEITEGLEVILKFNETICDGDQRPYQDIRISHTVILEDPFDDPVGFVVPDRSPEPTKEALMSDRIGADEAIDDTGGMTTEEIMEMQKNKEAKARATILEIVGDIPDADIAPPENVLFVCKLNPVTNDDDLEIIFSRFGKIVGCEVIRDHQTGDSLQYAFIEFADRKSCEDAYFKMDNVLIDDRRIHVDFSQSVAKMRWRGKGKGIRYFDEDDKPKKREDNYSSSRKLDASHNRDHDNGKSKEEGKRKESDKDRGSEHKKQRRREDRDTRDRRKEDRSYDERNKYDSERKDRRRREERRDRDRSDQRRGHSEDRSERRSKRDENNDRRRDHSEERSERRGRRDDDRERRHNERKRPDDDNDTRHRSHKHKRKRMKENKT
ncbi:PREDICTED: peptidyl-prolyl cis-trans isomerase-like 4 [Acromyrmex echinatior]|uniref:Peptidyl-prolyl cis-trans isomerase n=1 Tax=Acromyrmex echinatior TaxID=103372 RepID=F4WHN8_ACREC|nr:PREDICTED: peptidyl-prolyl cis-trans isomerase-like 4 [Acromyrmex echinatior]XP_011053069.1 PREDICTED: peptidyl-prolyl cis-trans isomerase-like 4 [Acromyrmex echinatior]XP_011053070.1 PREDICTED: peptidyl-prolyl cis-trans isomerase-like 4 [Acromyrmex echinatior]EGI66245.1 Peptidyl-prolyl cis-trans isomerase-like 4 [Acromyrmex echinatior]